jgi:hypothetical protein
MNRSILISEGPRQPLRLMLPAALAHRWMPGLFPEKVSDDERTPAIRG